MVNLTVCDQCSTPLGPETGLRLERIGDGNVIVRTLCEWETLDFCSWTCLAERAQGELERSERRSPPAPCKCGHSRDDHSGDRAQDFVCQILTCHACNGYDPLPDPTIRQKEA